MGSIHDWPPLPFEDWKDTCETLHRWTQIVGKVKLELCPFHNEMWQVGFHVNARGLTTGHIPYDQGLFQVDFDFIDHQLFILFSDGTKKSLTLGPRSVANFYEEFFSLLNSHGLNVKITTTPTETFPKIPFEEDEKHASYDKDAVGRWWRIQIQVAKILNEYRSQFFGKCSPILFYWGSFDLSTTRFSGRPAPLPEGPEFFKLAEDQENVNCGFWPGNVSASELTYGAPAFYSYAYPPPTGFSNSLVMPMEAYYDEKFNEFILPYEEVRKSRDPRRMIMEFLKTTYEAAALLGQWNRSFLENRPAAG